MAVITRIALALALVILASPSNADRRAVLGETKEQATVTQQPKRLESSTTSVQPARRARTPNTPTGVSATQESLQAGVPVVANPIKVTERPVSPNAQLKVPYCSTYQFRMKTEGGWGQVRVSRVEGIRRKHYTAAVQTTTLGAGDWRLLNTSSAPANPNASTAEIVAANAILVNDGPAPDAVFDFQLVKGVRPYPTSSGFGEALELHNGAVRINFKDARGTELKDAVELKHVVHPNLLEPIVNIKTINNDKTGYKPRPMITANANYIGCSGDVPYTLLTMHVKPSVGRAGTVNGAKMFIDDWPKGTTFDVTLKLNGWVAARTVRVVR